MVNYGYQYGIIWNDMEFTWANLGVSHEIIKNKLNTVVFTWKGE